ncbi:MAG TPA: aspartate 1-decarboxylase [Gammaproteobacteria bacterium]|nr:aspartate 1-decarboxylase [Gammaproteobacteria bacterium]
MQSTMLKCKLHRAKVTQVELEYEGSCAIDSCLLDSAGIHEYEQIHIYNVSNGERFVTYAIRAEEGSGVISVNGGAARRAARGDIVVICAYASLNQQELANFKPTLVYLDETNRITHIKNSIPVQAA